MELPFLLRGVGAEVCWITNQKPSETEEIIYSLEHKMLHRGVQENVTHVLPKVLWWIHEIRGHYFKMEFVKHLPLVAGAMIDSHVTADYWKNRTQERLKIRMPETYVVHFGNSKELMEVAEDKVAKGFYVTFGSVSHGKGQDLFLRAFYDSLLLIQELKLKVPSLHAVIVGSDMTAQTKFELELRNFVALKKIQNRVHFVNKTLTVAPYLAAINILARGECFGRITIEAMGFQLLVLGTSAGGTTEIVVNERTEHYICFVYNRAKENWILYDDHKVKVIGSWDGVLAMCSRELLQPLILFFEVKGSVPVTPLEETKEPDNPREAQKAERKRSSNHGKAKQGKQPFIKARLS
ncbi:Lipopolysaccharide core biosynthesis mannosyltransferase LpsB [Camellia lanceoleosa]|nr:Lipopolysaccharide core biosynthesis mannosyltransferase LpsB [Camellia lanceoleosa]